MNAHVAVLMGGWSAEREVSLTSGNACASALREIGYQVTEIDVDENLPRRLSRIKPDVVFNALHGRWGEDGCVQGLLSCCVFPTLILVSGRRQSQCISHPRLRGFAPTAFLVRKVALLRPQQ